MKIIKLEKKKRLYLLELDTSDKCYITEDTIVRFFLSKDKEISENDWKEIQAFAQYSYGKNLALYHISFKSRTKKEVRDYLSTHDVDQQIIPQILRQLEEENWINDRSYTESLLQQNQASGSKGPYVLQQTLLQKGIDKALAQELIQEEDFSSIAERLAKKALQTYQNKLPYRALTEKIKQALINKGFSYQDAKYALDSLKIETNAEQETDLIYKELEKQYRKYSKKYTDYELKQRLIQALARKGFDFYSINSALRDYF
ncbi:recombination regulator RecX [Streptococcus ovis]|uniref:recombination regulator RecX n=1 Tax=Streptococcus ovis TaxID=82806 RepID=UPI00037ADEFB|nr:recombination regulator RecX [Streptococcus ovis]